MKTPVARPLFGVIEGGVTRAALLVAAALCSHAAAAAVGMVEQPCPPPLTAPAVFREQLTALLIEPHALTPEQFARFANNADVKAFNEANEQRRAQDWAALCRFRESNAAVIDSRAPPRVVLMGDSITEFWQVADPGLFDGGVIDRGISGQTTAQMLLRFRADVVNLRPMTVHILAGTNDVAGNGGPTSPQDFRNNIESMVELAQANGIGVILGSIPPAAAFPWRPEVKPVPIIKELNVWLRDYAVRKRLRFIDYYGELAGPKGELKPDLGNDGVHPNRNGYRIMRRLLERELAAAPR
jgi:lysophospholipase L1-like esterase